MNLLDTLALAFINTFGITRPTDAARRRASWFILVLLLVMLCAVAAVGYAYFVAMHR